jgi:hypothetical protein
MRCRVPDIWHVVNRVTGASNSGKSISTPNRTTRKTNGVCVPFSRSNGLKTRSVSLELAVDASRLFDGQVPEAAVFTVDRSVRWL